MGIGLGIITLNNVNNITLNNLTFSNNKYYQTPILLIENGAS